MIEQDRYAAVHEAGHAVMCAALGVPVRRIAIFRDDQASPHAGIVICDAVSMVKAGRLGVEMFAAIYAAGGAAEEWLSGPINWSGARLDRENVFRMAFAKGYAGHPEALWATGYRTARASTLDNWSAVLTVARALLDRGALSGAEVGALLGGGHVQAA